MGRSGFRLTPGTKFRSYNARNSLILYRDVYLKKGRPPINGKFLGVVQNYFQTNKEQAKRTCDQLGISFNEFLNMSRELRLQKKKKGMPTTLSPEPDSKDEPSALRALDRYIKQAERLMKAAAVGDFPGKGSV